MAEAVRTADLRRLLAVVEAVRSDQAADGLPTDVFEQARDMVTCDGVALCEFDPTRRRVYLEQTEPANEVEVDPGIFWHHYWESAHCSYPDRSGDLLSVTTISDFYTRRQWRTTGMSTDYFSKLGIQTEVMLCLSAPAPRTRRLVFYRGPGRDFDGRDRLLLSLLRPHLNEAYQHLARRRRHMPDLTARQWELMHLLARGNTNTEIARELVVSVTTVRKHLENIFARLGVTNRTAAIAKAFPAPPY